ncbi:MAG: PQQ-binding-like beta-propeller repeat protein [Steroidobacteraceae bacterium]
MRNQLCTLLALALLAGCGTPRWGQFHADAPSQGSMGVNTASTLVVKWNLSTPPIGYASPVIAKDGKVLIGTATGQMVAIAPDGKPAWTFDANVAYWDAAIVSAAAATAH